jgi:hypothetical protein
VSLTFCASGNDVDRNQTQAEQLANRQMEPTRPTSRCVRSLRRAAHLERQTPLRLMRVLFIIAASLVIATPAWAKCALRPYRIAGVIVDRESGQPVQDATVHVFLDDYESTQAGGYFTGPLDFFTSDRSGRFDATAYFDTYSGSGLFGGDRCTRKPKKITLVVAAREYPSRRVALKFSALVVSGPTEPVVAVGILRLSRRQPGDGGGGPSGQRSVLTMVDYADKFAP